MATRSSTLRPLSLSFAASAFVASVVGCQIRVGDPNGADAATSDTDGCAQRGASDGCRSGNAEYDAARADWAKKQHDFDAMFAAEIKAFHAIEADLNRDDATPAIATKAEDLRARFVKRCIDESGWSSTACWEGTFARDITLALAKIRLRQGDLLTAAVDAYTIEEERDLRADDEKIWKAHGLTCEHDQFANRYCSTYLSDYDKALKPPTPVLSPELAALTSATTDHDKPVDWMGGQDVLAVAKNGASAVVKIKPWQSGAGEERSCGDAEWRRDGAGNDVLVRPCETVQYGAQYKAYPPAIVPASELGDFKLTNDTSLIVAYLPKGNHAGHVVETSIFTGETTDRGLRIFKRVLFRGLPAKDAKPGYP